MSFDDVRRRMTARTNAPAARASWDTPEYAQDVVRFNSLLTKLAVAIEARHPLHAISSRLRADRKRQFARRPNKQRGDRIETFVSIHPLCTEALGSVSVVWGPTVELCVLNSTIVLRLGWDRPHWQAEEFEKWWDGCRIGGRCYANESHTHPFLTDDPVLTDASQRIYQSLRIRKALPQSLEYLEEAIVFCAAYFGIPDAELTG